MSVRRVVQLATTVVSLSTFVLLYFGLVDLARLAGMHDARAWLYPLAIDGMVAAAYAATLALRGRHLAFAWAVIAVGSLMSLAGQWLHAEASSSWAFAGPVAAAPALCMSLVWHLLFLVSVRPTPDTEPDTVPDTVEDITEEPELRRWSAFAAPVPTVPSSCGTVSAPRVPLSVRDTDAVTALSAALSRGETMTGASMAAALKLHNADTDAGRRTGTRYLNKAKEALA